MAIASAKAMPRIMFVWITPTASGFRPSASIALPTRLPMPMPGPRAPKPIAIAAPMNFMPGSPIARRVNSIRALLCVMPEGALTAQCGTVTHSMTGLLRVLLTIVVSNGETGENEGQGAKDEGLDGADEKLEP